MTFSPNPCGHSSSSTPPLQTPPNLAKNEDFSLFSTLTPLSSSGKLSPGTPVPSPDFDDHPSRFLPHLKVSFMAISNTDSSSRYRRFLFASVSFGLCTFVAMAVLGPIAILAVEDAAIEDDAAVTVKTEAESRIYKDISYLASDELKGRAAETPGLKLAADYIAKRYSELGLQTDLFDGKPFQEFQLNGNPGASSETNQLKITKPDGTVIELSLGDQFQPLSLGSNGNFNAPLVFAGYGITANDDTIKYDDYAGLDVQGKVVLVLRKEPQSTDPNSVFAGTEPSNYAFFTSKEMNAAKHGAAALVLINDANSEAATPGALLPVSGAGNAQSDDKIPTVFVSRSIVEKWLAEAGKSLTDLESKIDSEFKPQSFELAGWTASGKTDISRRKIPSMNVLGLLPGKGSLADELVVVGAHFDHVGMGGAGSLAPGTYEIHNGADDNASGTVGLLETARRLTELVRSSPAETPRRSLLFIAFSGEELGLIGSEYYVNHPRFE
ncbi:MAG: M28 family peptidase, partial [Planctomycetes bacterium]|nr:M28 family peptidase [Planctomycetota bacterium]